MLNYKLTPEIFMQMFEGPLKHLVSATHLWSFYLAWGLAPMKKGWWEQ